MENALMQVAPKNVLEVFKDPHYCTSSEFIAKFGTTVPAAFRGKPGDILIAMSIAYNMGMDVFSVMSHLNIIQGKPSWSSQFIIAMINSCKKYNSLLYKIDNEPELGGLTCYCYTTEKSTGNEIVGPKITMKMAREEGWLTKNGSKWKTMPEVMIRYRAAAFFGRLNCPEVLCGIMYSTDEQYEMLGGEQAGIPYPTEEDFLDKTQSQPQEPAPEPAQKPVPEPAPEPAKEPESEMADKHEKMQIFTLAKTLFGNDANAKVKESLAKLGMESTQNLTRDNVKFILDDLNNATSAKEDDDEISDILDELSAIDMSTPQSVPLKEGA